MPKLFQIHTYNTHAEIKEHQQSDKCRCNPKKINMVFYEIVKHNSLVTYNQLKLF